MSYLDDSLGYLKHFEGSIAWMYLDTRRFVTVGVGEMLPNAAAAQSLSFVDSSGQSVSQDAILSDFNRVSELAPGQSANSYRSSVSPVLLPNAIDSLLMNHVQYFDGRLRARFSAFDIFPNAAKLGLLDMIYNLGEKGLFNGFPHFMGCVDKQDWSGAATNCHRVGPGPDRNAWTRQQFLAAAAAPALDPDAASVTSAGGN